MNWCEVTPWLIELAVAAREAYERQKQAAPEREWWDRRLEGVCPAERAYWRANGYYRCRCGAERRAREAPRFKAPSGVSVRICGACGRMCRTHWSPIDPPRDGVGA